MAGEDRNPESDDVTQTPEAPEGALVRASATDADPLRDLRSPGMREVFIYSLLAGLCPLLPVPLVDDLLIRTYTRQMVKTQLKRRGMTPTAAQVARLCDAPSAGCMSGCMTGVVAAFVFVLKKLFRKLVYILAVKDCVDVASKVLHQGWLIEASVDRGLLDAESLNDDAHLDRVRSAIDATCVEVDTRPVHQLLKRMFKSSRETIGQVTETITESVRSRPPRQRRDDEALEDVAVKAHDREEGKLSGLLDELTEGLAQQRGYLVTLEKTFVRHMRA